MTRGNMTRDNMATEVQPRLVAIDVRPGRSDESQSGLELLRPRIWGALVEPSARSDVAAIVMHPASNFMGHYLLAPLAARGVAALGLNSRYAGNDTMLLMERVLQDLGAGVAWLRAQGYRRVLLVGNSGGAALACFYAAQSQRLTAERFADGDATLLSAADLPPVQGLALSAAHLGRSRLLLEWLDPSVTDERDALATDPALDLYAAGRALPLDRAFLARFTAAQRARRDRIEAWASQRLATLRSTPGAARDEVFIVHRTHADPRFIDLTLDANHRAPGSLWGVPAQVNRAANAMGRMSSLTAWLSQWSSRSAADGPVNLAACSHPVLLLTHTADQSTFPSTREAWLQAGGERIRPVDLVGGNHYLAGQPALVGTAADEIAAFAQGLGRD
jgi:pimeloyl-ACP methyl ester carboxylesterase